MDRLGNQAVLHLLRAESAPARVATEEAAERAADAVAARAPAHAIGAAFHAAPADRPWTLPPGILGPLESLLSSGLGDVTLHGGSLADRATRRLGAEAFT